MADERIQDVTGIYETDAAFQVAEEAALVREAFDSPEALEKVCSLYIPKIYNYVLRRVGRVHDAEDITSTVFEKVLNNLGTFDSTRASFSTWVFKIAINTINDYYRSAGRKKEIALEEVAFTEGPCSDSDLERIDMYLVMMELLHKLSAKYQEVLTLRYFADMRVSELAETLGISETAASKRVVRGLEQLEKLARESRLAELF